MDNKSDSTFDEARRIMDGKTKPQGSLGRLEDIAVKAAVILGTPLPVPEPAAVIVFAADHGVNQEGVSAFPSSVTAQMVLNFLAGGAAISVLCKHAGIHLRVVDAGVAEPSPRHPWLYDLRVAPGTENFRIGPAMTRSQAEQSIDAGREAVRRLREELGAVPAVLGLGEMGIGNSTSAAAIVAALLNADPESCTGRGTGIDDRGLDRKVHVIKEALALHALSSDDPMGILAAVGGFEIGAIAGAAIEAAEQGSVVVMDGLISSVGCLLAAYIAPPSVANFIAAHRSVEPGHRLILQRLALDPLLDLGMRLGEGSGAALAIGLIRAACAIQTDMADFASAGVSGKLET